MARRMEYEKLNRKERQSRYFSEEFKRKKVKEIEKGIVTVHEVSLAYQVSSTAVYKWIRKYSLGSQEPIRLVVEAKSDTQKILLLKQEVKELEQLVGKKQIQLDFYEKMLELAKEEYGIDFKKKFTTTPLPGSGKKGKSTPTK